MLLVELASWTIVYSVAILSNVALLALHAGGCGATTVTYTDVTREDVCGDEASWNGAP